MRIAQWWLRLAVMELMGTKRPECGEYISALDKTAGDSPLGNLVIPIPPIISASGCSEAIVVADGLAAEMLAEGEGVGGAALPLAHDPKTEIRPATQAGQDFGLENAHARIEAAAV
jgi:hypothetical protein